jgi:hypothetical protein
MLVALAAPGVDLPTSRPSSPVCVYRVACRPPPMPDVAAAADGRDELIATIRVWEGEAMEHPPILFKLVVALGTAMLGGAGLLILGLIL